MKVQNGTSWSRHLGISEKKKTKFNLIKATRAEAAFVKLCLRDPRLFNGAEAPFYKSNFRLVSFKVAADRLRSSVCIYEKSLHRVRQLIPKMREIFTNRLRNVSASIIARATRCLVKYIILQLNRAISQTSILTC